MNSYIKGALWVKAGLYIDTDVWAIDANARHPTLVRGDITLVRTTDNRSRTFGLHTLELMYKPKSIRREDRVAELRSRYVGVTVLTKIGTEAIVEVGVDHYGRSVCKVGADKNMVLLGTKLATHYRLWKAAMKVVPV
jgi:hypothetical protein